MIEQGSGIDTGSIVNSDKGSDCASKAAMLSAIVRGTPRGATAKIIQTCQSSAVTHLLQSVRGECHLLSHVDFLIFMELRLVQVVAVHLMQLRIFFYTRMTCVDFYIGASLLILAPVSFECVTLILMFCIFSQCILGNGVNC